MDARVLRPVFFFVALRLGAAFFPEAFFTAFLDAGRLALVDLRATFFLRVAMVALSSPCNGTLEL
jgi:hypothetical protein